MIIESLFIALSMLSNSAGKAPRVDSASGGDSACGPRCVQWLLDYYGQPSGGLMQLIKDIQETPAHEATFEMLEKQIASRGISCRFVALGRYSLFDWPHPAIVHLDGQHFAIARSLSSSSVSVWLGIQGYQVMSPWRLRSRMSPTVLLTSPNQSALDSSYSTEWLRWSGLGVSSVVCVLSVYLIYRRVFGGSNISGPNTTGEKSYGHPQ